MLIYIAAAIVILTAALHSFAGGAVLIRPLLAQDWDIGLPRPAVDRILWFAWHLTSIAWVGLAAAMLGLPLFHAAALVFVLSGLLILVMLRGHLAWPLFLGAGACIWASMGVLPPWLLRASAVGGASLSLALAGLHAYWGVGGRRGLAAAVPQREDGTPAFKPGPLACFAVAAACAVLAGALAWPAVGTAPVGARVSLWLALGVFVLRAIGDGRQVGFSKANRDTAFARADDAIYSPLVVALAFACGASLLLT